METQYRDITLGVLAGGEGSRMGCPKAQIRVADEPILSYLLRQLKWPGPTLLVTAPGRTRPAGAEYFDREVVDPVARAGPLRGLLTALEQSRTNRLVVATVDMPAITIHQLGFLVNQLEIAADSQAILLDRAGQIEPFPSIYRREAVDAVRELLASNVRAVRALAGDRRVRVIPAPDDWPAMVWTNLNLPSDLAVLRHLDRGTDIRATQ
jgi:molybdopterin-guanine dinucleotide biosynthesis protein A